MGIVTRIPRRLGLVATSASAVYTDTGYGYDIAIGGLPFLLANDRDNPLVRETTQYRKQQIDQSQEPGEQSTAQWWLKSQSTFHLGAGQKYIDTPTPGNGDVRELRYASSTGLNPWDLGEVKLLGQTALAYSASTATLMTADVDGTSTQFLVAAGTTLTRVTETVSGTTPTYTTAAVTWGGTGTILGLTTDGTYYYVCDNAGLYRGKLTGGSPGAGTKQYNMPAGTSAVVLGWVKSRLLALVNVGGATPTASVYTLQSQPATPPAAFPTANYTHPNTDWVWSCVAEGPTAIYAAGYAGNRSDILKFTLDSSGAMPTLTGGASAASFPPAERVLGMTNLMNTALGVATSRGFRVGTFTTSTTGDVSLGPISLPSTHLTGGVCAGDRFFYAAGTHDDGTAGLFRIDTSQQLTIKQFSYTPDERFGWATDLRAADGSELPVAGSATVTGATVDGRLAFLVPGFGLYVQHPAKLVPSGTLSTSKIRFGTLDPKVFRFVRIRGLGSGGTISVATSTDATAGQTAGTLTVATKADTTDLATNLDAAVSCAVSFTLTRSATDNTVGPTLASYQLKALPAQTRQRDIILPLRVFDNDTGTSGQTFGGDGTALSRLLALEALEKAGDVVTLQYLGAYADQMLSEFVIIDSMRYSQPVDPTQRQNWGGVVVVTCRTIA